MKFKHIIKSRATLKKQKEYEFKELTPQDFEKGLKATDEEPYLVFRNRLVFRLYKYKNKLNVCMLHSFDSFEELKVKKK